MVLWFHGNAGNVGRWLPAYERVVGLGAHVFAVEYRGYGRSEGKPSEEGLYVDAEAAWKYLLEQRGFYPGNVVIFGYSLGGGVAVELASRVQPGGLIVQSSFSSIPDLATTLYPMVPRWLVRTQMNSLEKVGAITCPKLFVRSRKDRLIPYQMGRALYAAAAKPKEFFTVDNAGHGQTFYKGGGPLLEAIQRLIMDRRGRRE